MTSVLGYTALTLVTIGAPSQSVADIAIQQAQLTTTGNVIVVDWRGTADYTGIQEAIESAADGDTIVVMPSTDSPDEAYVEHINFLRKAIRVQSLVPTDPAVVAATVIDGAAANTVVRFEQGEGRASILDGLTITNGYTYRAAQGGGAGIVCNSSSPTIRNCMVVRNVSLNNGGGIKCGNQAAPQISGCIVAENTGRDYGGGIACLVNSNAEIVDCTVLDNTARHGGGIGLWTSCNASIRRCRIIRNTASQYGGGIAPSEYSDPDIINCVIADNTANDKGGGIYSFYVSSPSITHCTIRNNTDPGHYAVFVDHSGSIRDCVLWGNTGEPIGGSLSLVEYCNIEGGYPGQGNIDAAPDFFFSDDSHLRAASPCIDAGTDALVRDDADGTPRPWGVGYDIGAYEYDPIHPVTIHSPVTFEFTLSEEDPIVPDQVLKIVNGGGGVLDWSVRADVPWLVLSPLAGSSTGEVDEVLVNVAPTPHGQYRGRIIIESTTAANAPRVIEVSLTVTRTFVVAQDGSGDYETIQPAVDAAVVPGDIVLIQPGVYRGPGNKNVTHYGVAITVCSTDPNDPNVVASTVIDCEEGGEGIRFDYAGDGTTLAGLTIVDAGTAVVCVNTEATIRDCVVLRSRSFGMLIAQSEATILRCRVAEGSHYGILCQSCSPLITGCEITDNVTDFDGGGVSSYNASPILVDCVLARNEAAGNGGAVFGASSVTSCRVTDNVAGGTGGGLYGVSQIVNCDISRNSATRAGGMAIFGNGAIVHSTVRNNHADEGGGLVFSSNNTILLSVSNSIFWDNSAAIASQAWVDGWCTLDISHSTVAEGTDGVSVFGNANLIWGQGNLQGDPRFFLAEDSHLKPDSPCVDSGTGAGLDVDIDGNPRPLAGGPDMGAYEYNAAVPSIALSPRQLFFYHWEDDALPAPQMVEVANCGGGTLQWSAGSDLGALSLDPSAGASAGEINPVTVGLTLIGHGQYTGHVTVSATGAVNTPRCARVSIRVNKTFVVAQDGSGHYQAIQDAIDAADVPGDVIIVMPGLYTGPRNRELDFLGRRLTVRSSEPEDPEMVDATIIDCERAGRGFYFHNGETSESVVRGLTIRNAGHGIYCDGASPTIERCALTDHATGGIWCRHAGPIVSRCQITNNMGRGVYCESEPSPTLSFCVIARNREQGSGAGMLCGDHSAASVDHCLVEANTAAQDGGGIQCTYMASLVVRDTLIVGNRSSGNGGGVNCAKWNDLSLERSAIVDNVAGIATGGLRLAGSSAVITNSVCWGNAAPDDGQIALIRHYDDSTLAISFSDVDGGESSIHVEAGSTLDWAAGNIDAAPRFVRRGYWQDLSGSPADPYDDVWADSDYHLRPGSPCIDAGDPNSVVEPDETDLDGHPRFVDDLLHSFPGRGPIDIGPDEYVVADFDYDGDVDHGDFDAFHDHLWGPLVIVTYGCRDADMDGDGDCDLQDFDLLAVEFGRQTTGPGDIDQDGDVDLDDLSWFVGCLLGPDVRELLASGARADFDADGYCDLADVAVFFQTFGGPVQ
ncbi:MAG TPA: right-handed parallel beta-helix repeat-containing protein [Phycisphaerae bacterium]|nr:right-handed parallel beta-helix repeat-containing protein [Phycisphaerae bacterium]